MNKLSIAIPYSANDAVLAERLLDFIFFLNGRQPLGHVLLASYDVHEEMKMKVGIAAEVAFESVTKIEVPRLQGQQQRTKTEYANQLFRQVSQWMAQRTRWPWLWLEPDCVPLKKDWISVLADAYEGQPMRHLGSHMKSGDKLFMARVGIYHPGVFSEVDKVCEGSTPCNVNANLMEKCGKTKLIQQMVIGGEDDISKIRPDAVLLHCDKIGVVMEKKREPVMFLESSRIEMIPMPPNLEMPIIHKIESEMTPAQIRMAKVRAARGKNKQNGEVKQPANL